jgi:hypothetical protein
MQTQSAALDDEIRAYVELGYRLTTRAERSAHLVRPKVFSFGWALFWLLLLGIGLPFYLMYYLAKRDALAMLEVADNGDVLATITGDGPFPQPWHCPACQLKNQHGRHWCAGCQTPRP